MSPPLLDQRARPLRDLRISVIDRCNFRCPYCMPVERFGGPSAFLPQGDWLAPEELERIARGFVALGVRKLRLTGQSKHLVNLQLSLEDTDKLSQQTLLLTYTSPRATNRGPNLSPDYIERSGLRLDLILRHSANIAVHLPHNGS